MGQSPLLPKKSIPHTDLLVTDFMASSERRGLSPTMLRWYQCFLNDFAAKYPELPSKPEPIELWIASWTSGDERYDIQPNGPDTVLSSQTVQIVIELAQKLGAAQGLIKVLQASSNAHKVQVDDFTLLPSLYSKSGDTMSRYITGNGFKILQVIPASGWEAVFAVSEEENCLMIEKVVGRLWKRFARHHWAQRILTVLYGVSLLTLAAV